VNYFYNSIESVGLQSALQRVGEIEKLSRTVSGITHSSRPITEKSFSNMMSEVSTKTLKEKFSPLIQQAAKEHNMDPKLLSAVIEKESGFNPNAVSQKGAMGLMQLMPGTAQELGVNNPLNPQENIRAGTKYLSSLLNRYHGDVALALSAYNAGPGNVEKFKGIPPFKETQNYVRGIVNKLSV